MPSQVVLCELSFDATRQQWSMNIAPFVMPTSGMARDYHCSGKMPGGDYIVAGTSVGDMLVYKQSAQVYRASIPVCSNGLLSMVVVQETGQVFCGGGDGWMLLISISAPRYWIELRLMYVVDVSEKLVAIVISQPEIAPSSVAPSSSARVALSNVACALRLSISSEMDSRSDSAE